jgi:hypothetical protein
MALYSSDTGTQQEAAEQKDKLTATTMQCIFNFYK